MITDAGHEEILALCGGAIRLGDPFILWMLTIILSALKIYTVLTGEQGSEKGIKKR